MKNKKITLPNLIKSIKFALDNDFTSAYQNREFTICEVVDPFVSRKISFCVIRLDNPRDSSQANFATRILNQNELTFSEFKLVKGTEDLIREIKHWYVFYNTNEKNPVTEDE